MFSKLDKFSRVQMANTHNQRIKDEAKRQSSLSPLHASKLSARPIHKKRCCEGLNLTSFVLLIALSTHAFFEGIALGLTKSISPALNIMIGLLIHKTAASISLGISISKNFENDLNKGYLLLISFALATPIGIAIGLMLQDTSEMVEVVMSSFAAGTFIYIAASEVIVEEFSLPGRSKWLQMLTFLLGASLITSLWFLGG
jgi:zinc transporter 1/2/3